MFADRISVKAILAGFFGYLVLSTIAFAIVLHFWIPPGITNQAELTRIAEADPTLLLWQEVLGTFLGVLAGFATCRIGGAKGLRNSLVLGFIFVAYGALGIYLHPDHTMLMQISKLVVPVPLVLAGGWLCLRLRSSREARA